MQIYGNEKDSTIKKKEREDSLYIKYYRIFEGDEKYLKSKRMLKSKRVEKLLNYLEENNDSLMSNKYKDKKYFEINKIFEDKLKEEERKRRRDMRREKQKKRNISKKINKDSGMEIVF